MERVKLFSKLQDEDFEEKLKEKKRRVKYRHVKGAAVGGTLGALVGSTKSTPGSVVGAAVGGTAGYLLGNLKKKKIEKEVKETLDKYRNADEEDKLYLRIKEDSKDERGLTTRKLNSFDHLALASRSKVFSEKKKDDETSKVVGATVGAAGTGLAIYGGLKGAKKHLDKKVELAKEEVASAANKLSEFKGKVTNMEKTGYSEISRGHRAILNKEEAALKESLDKSAQKLVAAKVKADKVEGLLNLPKRVMETTKEAINKKSWKPITEAASNLVKKGQPKKFKVSVVRKVIKR